MAAAAATAPHVLRTYRGLIASDEDDANNGIGATDACTAPSFLCRSTLDELRLVEQELQKTRAQRLQRQDRLMSEQAYHDTVRQERRANALTHSDRVSESVHNVTHDLFTDEPLLNSAEDDHWSRKRSRSSDHAATGDCAEHHKTTSAVSAAAVYHEERVSKRDRNECAQGA